MFGMWRRVVAWRRAKAEDRAAVTRAENEELRAGGRSDEDEAEAEQEIIDAGSGTGFTR